METCETDNLKTSIIIKIMDKLIEELVDALNEKCEDKGYTSGSWSINNFTIEKGYKLSIKTKCCHPRLWNANCDTCDGIINEYKVKIKNYTLYEVINSRFDSIEKRFDSIDDRLNNLDAKLSKIMEQK